MERMEQATGCATACGGRFSCAAQDMFVTIRFHFTSNKKIQKQSNVLPEEK
jgi:hypothetical protein